MTKTITGNELRQMINEEVALIESYVTFEKILIAEARRREFEGASIREINEGIISDLMGMAGGFVGGLPGGFVDSVKSSITKYLLEKLGFSTDGLIAKAVINVIEEIEIMKIPEYFSEGGCEPFAEQIVQALGETIAEEGIDKLAGVLGIEDPNSIAYKTFRESLTNELGESALGISIKNSISDFVCNFNIQDALGKLGGMASKLFGFDDKAGAASGAVDAVSNGVSNGVSSSTLR